MAETTAIDNLLYYPLVTGYLHRFKGSSVVLVSKKQRRRAHGAEYRSITTGWRPRGRPNCSLPPAASALGPKCERLHARRSLAVTRRPFGVFVCRPPIVVIIGPGQSFAFAL